MSGFEFELDGFDEFRRKLEELRRRAQRLDGTHDVPFDELFTQRFMSRNTTFTSLEAMLDAGGITKIESADDLSGKDWDSHVARTTRFENWDAMFEAAAADWLATQMGLD